MLKTVNPELSMLLFRKKYFTLFIILFYPFVFGCNNNSESGETETSKPTPIISYSVTNIFPHDTSLYTEGLLFNDGKLFESTGSPDDLPQTRSLVGITDLKTGKFLKKIELDRTKYFGEGISFLGNNLYQLTYQNQIGFIYDKTTFKQTGTFTLPVKEGWGMTTNGKELIMSDGSPQITFVDTVSLKPTRVLTVTENKIPVIYLNELELINGYLFANIWQTNYIAKIDTTTGKVIGLLDLDVLAAKAKSKNPSVNVLNGIAYDSTTDKIFVTGKMWPDIYEIKFDH